MPYLLDTNVVCEATAKHPEPRVIAWFDQHAHQACLSSVTMGEIWKGIHLLPEGKRKAALSDWASGIERDFSNSILPLDTSTFKVWAELYARHEAAGHNLGVLDSLIAATALQHDIPLATRNTTDFPPEIHTVNPWDV